MTPHFTPTNFHRCGNTPPPLASQDLTDTFCNFACPGDSTDTCGGTGYISVFYDPTKYVEGTDPGLYGPQTPQQIGNYNYLGCYSEATNGRALSAAAPAEPAVGFTLESCMVACQVIKFQTNHYTTNYRTGLHNVGYGILRTSKSLCSCPPESMLIVTVLLWKHSWCWCCQSNKLESKCQWMQYGL